MKPKGLKVNKDYTISLNFTNNIKNYFKRILFCDKWHHLALIRSLKEGFKVFKNGSFWFNGTTDLLKICKDDYDINKEDFTIDFWINLPNRIRDWSLAAKINLMKHIVV